MPDFKPHPLRRQLHRVKGWKMEANGMSVTRPTKWGNPFRVGEAYPVYGWPMSAKDAVELFRTLLRWERHHDWAGLDLFPKHFEAVEIRSALGGKLLYCFCPLTRICHADVLCEIANGGSDG